MPSFFTFFLNSVLYGSIEDTAVDRKKTCIRLLTGAPVNITSKTMNTFIAGAIYISSAPLNRTSGPLAKMLISLRYIQKLVVTTSLTLTQKYDNTETRVLLKNDGTHDII